VDLDHFPQPDAFGRADVEAWARHAGLPEPITNAHLALVQAVADRCASLVDKYQVGDLNAGEEIRAMFGLG
jgi:hypothetical protein